MIVSAFMLIASMGVIEIYPNEILLHHQNAVHQIVVAETLPDQASSDVTGASEFQSSNPLVATVDNAGVVRAAGDGEAIVTATVNGQTVEIKVIVTGTRSPFVPSFKNHIQPLLFKAGCNTGACHGAAAGKNGFKLSLRGFDHASDHNALTRHANGRRVSLAAPAQSLILLKPTMEIPHEGGERFAVDSEAYERMLSWLTAGAPAIADGEPAVTHLEVLPKNVTLDSNAKYQILVRAHYDDDSYEDVTRWAKFGTTEETVATVGEEGRVDVLGPGATAITVYYQSKVATAQVTVPRAAEVAEARYTDAPRNNFIDDLVLAEIRRLRIPPADIASDSEFLRRVYLDTIGALPTPDETVAFLFDSNADKRERLVDDLLSRPEYADYWSYKWSDVLLLSSKNLPRREELTAFYRFIHDSVASNKPWDEFVRQILTATGNSTENGAANFFAMHKEPIELTETTSQAFLGMSITCARCHNHPLEKWTQDDYYGMANLLGRVKRKNGKSGGTDILPAAFGDVVHPRLGRPLPPKPLEGEALSLDDPGDRRIRLAEWMTAPDNPYFTRAVVNRVWRNFMGTGLVEPEDDLRLTNPPSNAALLDALAADLIDHEYDLQHLMRTIMNSAAYQRTSKPADGSTMDDRFYSAYVVRRLSAEVILDAYSQVTGVPTQFGGYPGGFRALQLPDSQVGSYFLTAFGRPERIQTCSCERTEDSSVAQTLHIANGETLNGKLRAEKSHMAALAAAGRPPGEVVDELYICALARFPSDAEKENAVTLLEGFGDKTDAGATARRESIEDLTWALLTSKEFLFNH